MKVLLINGSPRQEGNTATALKEVAKQLNSEGIDSEIAKGKSTPFKGYKVYGKCLLNVHGGEIVYQAK